MRIIPVMDLEAQWTLDTDYAPADFSGVPDSAESVTADIGADSDTGSGDCSADSGGDTGGADAGDGDGGTSSDPD